MKNKNKQRAMVLFIVLAFIFPLVVKVLNLGIYEIALCVLFFKIIDIVLKNFPNGEALLAKLSIIT